MSPSFVWPSNYTLFGLWLALSLFGLVMVTSASMEMAGANSLGYLSLKHGAYLLIAAVFLVLAWLLPLDYWYRFHRLLFLAGLLSLGLVLMPYLGQEVNGSRRWIKLSYISLQPTEFFKICFVVYMAAFIARIEEIKKGQSGLIRIILLVSLPVALILQQPDFGSVVLLITVGLAMLLIAGFPLGRLFAFLLIITGLATVAIVTQPYRMQRLIAFLDPWADKYHSGYQLTQALIAFGRGDLTGLGLGQGIQKLAYLPEPHTDFLFAVIGEELGLIGTLVVLAAFSALIVIGLILSWRALSQGRLFPALLAAGITMLIGAQTLINTGTNIGILPTKGLTLPLVSYGGNSLIVTSLLIGILLRIQYELTSQPEAKEAS